MLELCDLVCGELACHGLSRQSLIRFLLEFGVKISRTVFECDSEAFISRLGQPIKCRGVLAKISQDTK
jgi:hypothetical protein